MDLAFTLLIGLGFMFGCAQLGAIVGRVLCRWIWPDDDE